MPYDNFALFETEIKDLYVFQSGKKRDARGFFTEIYRSEVFDAAGLGCAFVQDNVSVSRKGVLRGLHFQLRHPQAKLVRVLQGEVYDVAVDLREDSESFGKWKGVLLSEKNGLAVMIPKGFAHGFLSLSDPAMVFYKCDEAYDPEDQGGIAWDDGDLQIEWPEVGEIILSEKDKKLPTLHTIIKR